MLNKDLTTEGCTVEYQNMIIIFTCTIYHIMKDPEKAAEMLSLIDDSSMIMSDEVTSDPSAFFRYD